MFDHSCSSLQFRVDCTSDRPVLRRVPASGRTWMSARAAESFAACVSCLCVVDAIFFVSFLLSHAHGPLWRLLTCVRLCAAAGFIDKFNFSRKRYKVRPASRSIRSQALRPFCASRSCSSARRVCVLRLHCPNLRCCCFGLAPCQLRWSQRCAPVSLRRSQSRLSGYFFVALKVYLYR